MARDRQRAKQRKARRAQHSGPAPSQPRRSDVPGELDRDRPIAVGCASGQRAAVGASLLQRHGATAVWHVVEGGVPRWERQGWPISRD